VGERESERASKRERQRASERERERGGGGHKTCGSSARIGTTSCCFLLEEGSHLRLTDSCISQLNHRIPSRTCNESKAEEAGFLLTKNNPVPKILIKQHSQFSDYNFQPTFSTILNQNSQPEISTNIRNQHHQPPFSLSILNIPTFSSQQPLFSTLDASSAVRSPQNLPARKRFQAQVLEFRASRLGCRVSAVQIHQMFRSKAPEHTKSLRPNRPPTLTIRPIN